MRGLKQQEPSFRQPLRKLSWQFSSASLRPKTGTGENDRYADGASNLRKKPVQKIGEHYKSLRGQEKIMPSSLVRLSTTFSPMVFWD